MAEATFKCWNCRKQKPGSELASVSLTRKIGLTFIMFLLFRYPYYPDYTCKSCLGQAKGFGVVGLILLCVAALCAVFTW